MTRVPTLVTISSEVLFQELAGETVLLNIANEQYYGFDDVGTRIWQLLNEHGGETELVISQMLAEYDVDEALLRTDMANLIAKLAEAGLITTEQ